VEVQEEEVEAITRYHWVLFGICLLSNVFGGTVSVLMSVYLPLAVNDLLGRVEGDQLNYMSAYVNSIFIFGWAIGGMIWGYIGDRMGRAQSLVLSIGSFGLFAMLTGFTDSWTLVLICRFLSGFGVGGVLVITPTILSEVWPEKSRSIFIGILSIGFPVGIFSAGLIDLFVSNWNQAFLVGIIPFCLAILAISHVQESGEWKSMKSAITGSTRERAVLFGKKHRNDLILASVAFGTMLIGLWAIFLWVPTWVQTLLGDSDGQHERGIAMMVLGGAGLVGGFFSGWLTNAIGHRRAMMLCFAGCSFMSFLLFKLNASLILATYFEIALLSIFFGASQGVLSSYIPGLFPPSIRATATGFCFNIGRFVTGSVVFFVGALVSSLGGYGNAIFTFSLVFIIGLIATYFSKEVTSASK
jgi:MFS family permease